MATEVFNRIGESEIYSENPRFFKEKDEDNDLPESTEKIESKEPISEAKREFLEHLNNDSLTIDKCSGITHDWKRKN